MCFVQKEMRVVLRAGQRVVVQVEGDAILALVRIHALLQSYVISDVYDLSYFLKKKKLKI